MANTTTNLAAGLVETATPSLIVNSPTTHGNEMTLFPSLPLELALEVWPQALPPSQIITIKRINIGRATALESHASPDALKILCNLEEAWGHPLAQSTIEKAGRKYWEVMLSHLLPYEIYLDPTRDYVLVRGAKLILPQRVVVPMDEEAAVAEGLDNFESERHLVRFLALDPFREELGVDHGIGLGPCLETTWAACSLFHDCLSMLHGIEELVLFRLDDDGPFSVDEFVASLVMASFVFYSRGTPWKIPRVKVLGYSRVGGADDMEEKLRDWMIEKEKVGVASCWSADALEFLTRDESWRYGWKVEDGKIV